MWCLYYMYSVLCASLFLHPVPLLRAIRAPLWQLLSMQARKRVAAHLSLPCSASKRLSVRESQGGFVVRSAEQF